MFAAMHTGCDFPQRADGPRLRSRGGALARGSGGSPADAVPRWHPELQVQLDCMGVYVDALEHSGFSSHPTPASKARHFEGGAKRQEAMAVATVENRPKQLFGSAPREDPSSCGRRGVSPARTRPLRTQSMVPVPKQWTHDAPFEQETTSDQPPPLTCKSVESGICSLSRQVAVLQDALVELSRGSLLWATRASLEMCHCLELAEIVLKTTRPATKYSAELDGFCSALRADMQAMHAQLQREKPQATDASTSNAEVHSTQSENTCGSAAGAATDTCALPEKLVQTCSGDGTLGCPDSPHTWSKARQTIEVVVHPGERDQVEVKRPETGTARNKVDAATANVATARVRQYQDSAASGVTDPEARVTVEARGLPNRPPRKTKRTSSSLPPSPSSSSVDTSSSSSYSSSASDATQ